MKGALQAPPTRRSAFSIALRDLPFRLTRGISQMGLERSEICAGVSCSARNRMSGTAVSRIYAIVAGFRDFSIFRPVSFFSRGRAELHRTNSRIRLDASGSTKTQKSYLADNGRAAASSVSTGRYIYLRIPAREHLI